MPVRPGGCQKCGGAIEVSATVGLFSDVRCINCGWGDQILVEKHSNYVDTSEHERKVETVRDKVEKIQMYHSLMASGISLNKVADQYGISSNTVLRQMGSYSSLVQQLKDLGAWND